MDIHSAPIVVAGCGSMGLPMARQMLAAGFLVSGYDVRPPEEFGDFADHLLPDAVKIAQADVLVSVVRDEDQTLALCFDEQGVFRRDSHPRWLVVSSTLSPRFVLRLEKMLPDDVVLVDAPMSGAPFSAERGTLTFMLGGPAAAVDFLLPLFECMGERLFRAGDTGSGMTLKVLNNYVAACSVVAVRRAIDMAQELGVETELLRYVMQSSSGGTWFGNRFAEIDWAREGYDPGNTIGILEKDVRSALDAVRDRSEIADHVLDHGVLDALRALKPLSS